ncbi:MAG: NAD(P)H-hydrate dehydratase [Chitinophagaceae bacterium]
MKILSATQIQQWDAFTIEHEPITSINLMERAAQQCTDWIIKNKFIDNSVKIFCGKGNNGGDGLAIVRQLIEKNIFPSIYIIEFGAKGTEDFQNNLARLHQLTTDIFFIQSKEFFPEINKNDIIIDALFGSGLNRPLQNLSAELVEHINTSNAKIISVDVPSGMFLDKSSVGNAIIKANYTLTFQTIKLCFLVAENADYFGEVKLLEIGLHQEFLKTIETAFQLTTQKNIVSIFKPRKSFSNKGTYGHALLFAGSKGKMGAAIIASKACLRSGVGLLTVNVDEENLFIIQTAVPEAMAMLQEDKIEFEKYTTIGIGPGFGFNKTCSKMFEEIISQFKKPIIIDADALTILSLNKEWLNNIPAGSILTPHPKEFDRVFGNSANDFERIDKAIALSKQYSFILILKGHYTLIAANGKGFFNTTGNAGMAKGGSGDMLTGILTSLLAQCYNALQASVLGVYIHGLSADISLENQSLESLLPSDMIEHLGKAFKIISSN